MADANAQITYASSYDPYGVVTSFGGSSQTAFGYTGEQTDINGLVYLPRSAWVFDPAEFCFEF
jgi:hypothetical protein